MKLRRFCAKEVDAWERLQREREGAFLHRREGGVSVVGDVSEVRMW
jgi:hypothetical protein